MTENTALDPGTKMDWYRLTPVDGWFFGDSRPSKAGENQSDLRSLCPPHPQTVVGAFRAAVARRLGWTSGPWSAEMKQRLGDGFDDVMPLSFTAPMLALQDDDLASHQLLYVTPKHLVGLVEVNDGNRTFIPKGWLSPASERYATDSGDILLPRFPQPVIEDQSDEKPKTPQRLKPADDFFVTAVGMQQIVEGKQPQSEQFVHRDRLFAFEDRIGIDRDPENRSMYSPGFVRLKNGVSLVIGLSGLASTCEVPSLFPLGGESRMTHCVRLDDPPAPPVSLGGNLVMLTSPASFAGDRSWYGAGPGDPAQQLSGSLAGRVVTCVLDRPIKIGGFDSRTDRKQPLPLKPFAPAGTVWWLDEPNPSTGAASLSLGLRTSLGYGSALLGKLPN